MAVKNISIMEDVYRLLVRRKNADESFSDVIRRELNRKKNIMEFAGAWKDIVSDEEVKNMKKTIKEFRRNSLKGVLRKIKTK